MLSRLFAEGAALGSARWSEGCNQLKLAGSAFMRPLHLLKRRAYPSPILRFLVIASPFTLDGFLRGHQLSLVSVQTHELARIIMHLGHLHGGSSRLLCSDAWLPGYCGIGTEHQRQVNPTPGRRQSFLVLSGRTFHGDEEKGGRIAPHRPTGHALGESQVTGSGRLACRLVRHHRQARRQGHHGGRRVLAGRTLVFANDVRGT